MKNTNIIIFST